MIIVRLIGGLGNQMFQYALGRALASRHNVPLKLDTSAYAQYPLRKYRLHHFNIAATVATPAEVAQVTGAHLQGIRKRFYAFYQRRLPYYARARVKERNFHYDPNMRKVRPQTYLIGFWQSEKYFKDVAAVLRKEFTLKHPPDAPNQAMLQHIEAVNAVSVHVRRTDYVTDPAAHHLHNICTPAYYKAAIGTLAQSLEAPHFFIFSDDMPWVRQHLTISYPVTYVDHNDADHGYEDLRLMRYCKHHIIANSTFSWWGAWLSEYQFKQILAPGKWFTRADINTSDVIPASWLQLG